MFDGEVDGEVAWTLVSIEGGNDRLAVDNTTGRHHHQELTLQMNTYTQALKTSTMCASCAHVHVNTWMCRIYCILSIACILY